MSTTPRSRATLVPILCGVLILFDGYDLIVYGTIVPALLQEPGWGVTAGVAGRIASLTLVGMAIGALLAGTVADRVGRRPVIFVSLAWFSVSMLVCGLAPSLAVFEIARILGGLGLGAMFPLATALIVEFAPPGRRALVYAFSFFGYLVGGILAGALGLVLIQPFGWRVMFWIGALPLLLLPVLVRVLPESTAWLTARGRVDQARVIAERYGLQVEPARERGDDKTRALALLFSKDYALSTALLWGVEFCSLLLVFGMVTWLPTIMTQMQFSMGFALAFVLVLNLGAALGAYLAARTADRIGPKFVAATLFVIGAAAVALLAVKPATVIVFVLVALAGAGTLGTQILVNVLAASLYPASARATGLGWALGVGRIGGIVGPVIGGAILASSLGAQWNFYVFAVVAAVGALLTALLPLTPAARRGKNSSPQPVAAVGPHGH